MDARRGAVKKTPELHVGCGCRFIGQDFRWCPLHVAALEMYELLRRLHDAVYVLPVDADTYHDDWMRARDLLARLAPPAERRPQGGG